MSPLQPLHILPKENREGFRKMAIMKWHRSHLSTETSVHHTLRAQASRVAPASPLITPENTCK